MTANESEALILEANLIKQHRPPFNIELKDDKRYPFLKVSLCHPFPGLYLTRKIVQDGSRYFGPYTHVKDLRQTLKTLRKVFPLRNCTDRRVDADERECLEYFIERCPAPCTRRIDPRTYATIVRRLVRFLEGDVASVVGELAGADAGSRAPAAPLRGVGPTARRYRHPGTDRAAATDDPRSDADTDVVAIVVRGETGLLRHPPCTGRKGAREGDHGCLRGRRGAPGRDPAHGHLPGSYLEAPPSPAEIVAGHRCRGRRRRSSAGLPSGPG